MRDTIRLLFVLSLTGVLTIIGSARHHKTQSGPVNDYSEGSHCHLGETFEAPDALELATEDPWPPADVMEPDALARLLSGDKKPAVFQVGIVHLYRLSHITGSKYAGPGNSAEGLSELKRAAQGVDRNTAVVFYCGCCPWTDCPNIRPAYKTLREMGFKNVKVLHLPTNFTQDWAQKGFPVEKGNG